MITDIVAWVVWGGMFGGAVLLWILIYDRHRSVKRLEHDAERQLHLIKKEIEAERREAVARLKDELHKRRTETAAQIRKEEVDLERLQVTLNMRSEKVREREIKLDVLQQTLQNNERSLARLSDQLRVSEQRVKTLGEELTTKLEGISCLSREEARKILLKNLEENVLLSSKKWVQKVEEEARKTAKERSIQIVVDAMQRHAGEHIAVQTSGVVTLPNEEMKGRIIGKEGRNIKALEMATGMEFIIGESPESITIAGFNPIRREVARRSLEKLLKDGRINPTRIEETVLQCEHEIESAIEEYGRNVVIEFNLQGLKDEIVMLLGRLHFRTSFSQNVLAHSIEVGRFARTIAEELGLPNPHIALRGGLLHDIGKALSAEIEGPHALLGADIAKRCGEDQFVVNAIAAHHQEVPFESVYSPVVLIADMISAARPGARRETLSTYIKRLEKLEEIAYSFDGVKKAYALQAGREIRVIVEEQQLDDDHALILARTLARKIEEHMDFPGEIKVNVIRESRAIEYAR